MKSSLLSLLLALFLAGTFSARAQDNNASDSAPTNSASAVTDPAQVAQRYNEILSRPIYRDVGETDTHDQIRDWLAQWFGRFGTELGEFKYAEEMPRFASLLMTLFVFLSLAALLYLLVRIARRKGAWKPGDPAIGETETALQSPEFYEEELARAKASGDWRRAWLASWRQFLSRLERDHLVAPDRSRTNREYLRQLRDQPLPSAAVGLLAHLVEAYDQFIYGRKAITESDWDAFRQEVDEATLLLHLEERPAAARAS